MPLATGTDNVNANALIGYFMLHSIYEPIMKVLIAPTSVPGSRAFPRYFPQLDSSILEVSSGITREVSGTSSLYSVSA